MSFHILKTKWLERISEDIELPDSASRIAIALAKHFNKDSETAWPSAERLSKMTGHTERNVQRVLKMLQDRGYLKTSTGRGRGHSNTYAIALKDVSATDRGLRDRGSPPDKIRRQGRILKYDPTVAENTTVGSYKPTDKNLPPNTPTKSGGGPAASESAFEAFEAVWPWKANESRSAARQAFDRLPSAADKRQAIDAARAAAKNGLAMEKLGRASRWLSGQCFKNFRSAPEPRAASDESADYVVVLEGTPGFDEWMAYHRRQGRTAQIRATPQGRALWRKTQFPPQDGAAR